MNQLESFINECEKNPVQSLQKCYESVAVAAHQIYIDLKKAKKPQKMPLMSIKNLPEASK